MIIGSHQNLKKCNSDFRIVIGNTPIKRVSTTKSLGVMIDETLTWRSQVDVITKKVNKSIYVLRRLREFTDLKTLVTAYKLLSDHTFATAHKFGGALESPSKINCSSYNIGQYVLLQSVDMTTDQ